MSEQWNQRYSNSTAAGAPCRLLTQFQHLLPAQGRALDLACGLGANALLLAECGLQAQGWDSSAVAIAKLKEFAAARQLAVTGLVRDVEGWPPEPASFDVIVVSHFLYRPICPALVEALRPGGLLFYQTYHREKLGDSGPSSPKYLLTRGELLRLFAQLQPLYYREDARVGAALDQGLRDCSYFIGQRPVAGV